MSRLDVAPIIVDGLWVRHGRDAENPLPDRAPPPNSRWQRGAVVDALYLADSEATAWAEWYRYLAESGLPPHLRLPTYLWTWRVNLEVVNLQSRERLKKVGLVPPQPSRPVIPKVRPSHGLPPPSSISPMSPKGTPLIATRVCSGGPS